MLARCGSRVLRWPSSMSAFGVFRVRTQWRKFSLCSGSGKRPLHLGRDHAVVEFRPREHLPAAAVPADDHQPFAAVDFDPRGALRPVGKLRVALANQRRDLQHVGRVEGQLEAQPQAVEIEDGHLRVGRFGRPLLVESPARSNRPTSDTRRPAASGPGRADGWRR